MEEILPLILSVATGIFSSWLYEILKRKPTNHDNKLSDTDITNHIDPSETNNASDNLSEIE